MKIKINRFNKEREPSQAISNFEVPLENPTLLETFKYISEKLDKSFVFSSSCESSVCGSCGVIVNGKEVLACQYRAKENDEISPLKNLSTIKDLVVDRKEVTDSFARLPIASDDSTCILCNLCYSACPVFEVNEKFANPIILSRILNRLPNLDEEIKTKTVSDIQTDGIWDCTLCGLCSEVCPQNIDSKNDILKLQSVSAQYGFTNPNMFNMSFGFGTEF